MLSGGGGGAGGFQTCANHRPGHRERGPETNQRRAHPGQRQNIAAPRGRQELTAGAPDPAPVHRQSATVEGHRCPRSGRRRQQPLHGCCSAPGNPDADAHGTAALVDQDQVQAAGAGSHRPRLEVEGRVGHQVQTDQPGGAREGAGEGDQSVQQWPGDQPLRPQREGRIDRVGPDVKVDAVGSSAQEGEQHVGSPQGGCERVADPRAATAGDRVELGQAERQPGPVGGGDQREQLRCLAAAGVLGEHPAGGGARGAPVQAGRVRVAMTR